MILFCHYLHSSIIASNEKYNQINFTEQILSIISKHTFMLHTETHMSQFVKRKYYAKNIHIQNHVQNMVEAQTIFVGMSCFGEQRAKKLMGLQERYDAIQRGL